MICWNCIVVNMKGNHRTPTEEEIIALRVPSSLAAEIKRQAREDDRTLSGFLRRRLADVFGVPAKPAPSAQHERESR